eukprot:s1127_g18.t1
MFVLNISETIFQTPQVSQIPVDTMSLIHALGLLDVMFDAHGLGPFSTFISLIARFNALLPCVSFHLPKGEAPGQWRGNRLNSIA